MADESRGYTVVHVRSDGNDAFRLTLADYDGLAHALDHGDRAEWYEGTDLYGDRVRIRLRDIIALSEATPEALAVYDAEQEDARLARLFGDVEPLEGEDT